MQRIAVGPIAVALFISPDLASAKQAGVPQFDVARTCQEARASASIDKDLAYRGCLNDENEARDQLARKWGQFRLEDRNDCVAQGAAPLPSYVELLTCLEMSEQAGALFRPETGRQEKPKGGAVQSPKPGQATPSTDAAGAPAAPPEPGGVMRPD